MKTAWIKGLTAQKKDELTRDFEASSHIRARLSELIEEKRITSYKSTLSKDAYECPNWAFMQADARGYERAISEILSLIESDSLKTAQK